MYSPKQIMKLNKDLAGRLLLNSWEISGNIISKESPEVSDKVLRILAKALLTIGVMYQYQEPKLHFGPSSPLEFKDVELVMKTQVLMKGIFPVLNNFISYVSEVLSKQSEYFEKLLDINGGSINTDLPGTYNEDNTERYNQFQASYNQTAFDALTDNPTVGQEWMETHDKKLTVLAICSILGAGLFLLIGALKLFENLPQSINGRYELEMEYSNNDSDGSVDEDEFGIMTLEGLDDEIESLLWSDENLWETPLDKVDFYKEFYKVMKCIESSNKPMMIESELGVIMVWVWLMALGDESGDWSATVDAHMGLMEGMARIPLRMAEDRDKDSTRIKGQKSRRYRIKRLRTTIKKRSRAEEQDREADNRGVRNKRTVRRKALV
ncbi:hypothetical protein PPACK8108_LOCUS25905 [Phakopsora pachyrhizi]|uniref:Uncharacterized protein n=1 Tax=Phakopsora pachyrhizi TaxID=170000 RepID=A0AAV0BTP4_PHAPC|nr:hypothetical protein PPACK8108_LOCUS25905 [Phakopsora pachyrhizi]